MKTFLSCCALLMVLSSCSYVANIRVLTGGEIRRTDYVQHIPFTFPKDIVVVGARLHADTTVHAFIFDTGAFDGKVEYTVADRLDMEVVSSKTNSTAQGISRKTEVVRIDSLRLGDTWAYDIGAGKLAYAPSSASQCLAPGGIIGANLIKLAHWRIDYGAQTLSFSDQPFAVDAASVPIPFKRPRLSGTPTIQIHVDGTRVDDVLLDVGYNGGLVLPMALADRFESPTTRTLLDRSTSGIYGTNMDSVVVKALRVEVGGHEAVVPVEFSALGKSLLGNEFLKHFRVFIDYDRKHIHLEPQRDVDVSWPRTFMLTPSESSGWIVSRTEAGTGVALGDTVLTVNGHRPGDLFDSYCDYVLNTDRLFMSDSLSLAYPDGSVRTVVVTP